MAVLNLYLLISAYNIALCLSLNLNSAMFKLYSYNNSKALKFNVSFERSYLLGSYKTYDKSFNLYRCILFSTQKSSSTKAIAYEVNNDSKIACRSYSSLNVESTDILMTTSSNSMIFLRNEFISNYIYLIPLFLEE
jgi:hypothetical protein